MIRLSSLGSINNGTLFIPLFIPFGAPFSKSLFSPPCEPERDRYGLSEWEQSMCPFPRACHGRGDVGMTGKGAFQTDLFRR